MSEREEKAVRIARDLYRLGYDICGFVAEDEKTPVKADRKQVVGTVADIPLLMGKVNVDEIVLAVESKNNKALMGILYSLYRYKRPIKVLADRVRHAVENPASDDTGNPVGRRDG